MQISEQRSDNEQVGRASTDNLLTERVFTNGAILVDEDHLEGITRHIKRLRRHRTLRELPLMP